MTELLLVRHGLPESMHHTGPGAGADPPLTGRGTADADRLARHLASRPERGPDAVWTSPMLRARQTAEPIARTLACPLHVDDRLREFDHGAPAYAPPEQVAPEVRARMWRALETGEWDGHRFDPDEFERTVAAAMADVVARHPGARVAVVCHSGVINSFVGAVLRRPRGMFFRPAYTSVSRLAATRDGRFELLSLNETGHLDPSESPPENLSEAPPGSPAESPPGSPAESPPGSPAESPPGSPPRPVPATRPSTVTRPEGARP